MDIISQNQPLRARNLFAGLTLGQERLIRVIPDLEDSLERFIGKKIKRSPAKALGDFGLLPEIQQLSTVDVLEQQHAFLMEAVRNGIDSCDEAALARLAISKLSLMADENSLTSIENTDVVEIVGGDGTQLYRSYSCFALCNYSIAELVTYPWYDLYERPSWVQDRIVTLANSVFSGEHSHLALQDKIPKYSLKEKLTDERAAFLVQEKSYSRMRSFLNRETYVLSTKSVISVESGPTSGLAFL